MASLSTYRVGRAGSNVQYKKIREYFGIVIILIVTLLRFDVGYDYYNYYQAVNGDVIDVTVDRFEPLSKVIMYIAHYWHCPQIVFILFGIITYYCLFSTFRHYSVNFYLGIIVYIAFFYLSDLSTIRQAAAVAISFYGIKYIESKSFIKYLLICLIASLFHFSAIVSILIYFLYNDRVKIYYLIILDIFLLLFSDIVFNLLQGSSYSIYLEVLDEMAGGSMLGFSFILWFILIFTIDKIFTNSQSSYKKLYNVIFAGLIFPFVFGGHLGLRLSQYYFIYFCLLIPHVLCNVNRLVRWSVVFMLFGYFIIALYINKNSDGAQFIPYKCILFENTEFLQFRR